MMLWSVLPAAAALVAKPARSECPLNFSGSSPVCSATRFTRSATSSQSKVFASCKCSIVSLRRCVASSRYCVGLFN
jgi:hypothetical protein